MFLGLVQWRLVGLAVLRLKSVNYENSKKKSIYNF